MPAECCVCHRPIEGEPLVLGGRPFCATHYERVTREGPTAASPVLLALGGVALFAAVVGAIGSVVVLPARGPGVLLAGIVLALVPAGAWLVAFYRLDRLEPEPKRYVLGVFLLGALLAQAVGEPVIRDLFRIQEWVGLDPVTSILGSIFVLGFVREFVKYAAVRYTVYRAAEFDERVDGIIYAAAAGLGYATAMNVQYVVGNAGVDLGVGATRVAVTALAQASSAAVVGYFLGRAKFESMGPLWLPLGLTIAAVLNGLTTYLLGEVSTVGGLGFNPWPGLLLAAVVAAAIFAALFAIVRRTNAATLAAARRPQEGAIGA
ncbi:MAG: PrsW family intramembrane metalloprotease [Chloroflexi bacterium]|nr:PrsW family intramembrane metalloprotease [Chloroflexota bacterium]